MQPITDMTKQYANWKADLRDLCLIERAALDRKRYKHKNPSGLSENPLYVAEFARMQQDAINHINRMGGPRGMSPTLLTNQLWSCLHK